MSNCQSLVDTASDTKEVWFDIYRFDDREILQGNSVEMNCFDTYFKVLKFSFGIENKNLDNSSENVNDDLNYAPPKIKIELFGALILTQYSFHPTRKLPLELGVGSEIYAVKCLTGYITYQSEKLHESKDNDYAVQSTTKLRKRTTRVEIREYLDNNRNNSNNGKPFTLFKAIDIESTTRRISNCIRFFIDKKTGDTKVVLNNEYSKYQSTNIQLDKESVVNWDCVHVVLKDLQTGIDGIEVYDALNQKSFEFQQKLLVACNSHNVNDSVTQQPTTQMNQTTQTTDIDMDNYGNENTTQGIQSAQSSFQKSKKVPKATKQGKSKHNKATQKDKTWMAGKMLLREANSQVDSENEEIN